MVSVGGRQATHPARSENAPLSPHPPTPCLVPAVLGTASIELVWVPPGVRMASMGRAYLLLRLIQCPCPTLATSRTLSPPPAAGDGPCQARSTARAASARSRGQRNQVQLRCRSEVWVARWQEKLGRRKPSGKEPMTHGPSG